MSHFYLCGGMAGLEHGNRPAFRAAAKHLRASGHDVTSPTELNDADGEKGALDIGHPNRPAYLLRDLAVIASPEVDAVVVLPGWEDSTGAWAEVKFARAIGVPVLQYHGLSPIGDPVDPPPLGRHPLSARFHEVLQELGALHDLKSADYGREEDPFANVRGTAEWGIPPWEGSMIRGTDKVKRLQAYARTGSLKNEGVRDSFLDLAVYTIIALVLFEEESAA